MQKSRQTMQKKATGIRGRPRAFEREAALAQATRLFWSKGYEATSLSDLTDAMGIGSTSLYAAFGSKKELYVEALRYYGDNFQEMVWANFFSASTVRQAVMCLLMDSAAAVTGSVTGAPRGCMVTLSAVDSEGHFELGELVRTGRAEAFNRIEARLNRAVSEGELAQSTDIQPLARFVQTVQSGMSILARDGACRSELEEVAETAMRGWDAMVVSRKDNRD